jgi:hypothetical protein
VSTTRGQGPLAEWAQARIPAIGQKRLFFAQKTGPMQDLTDARWVVVGHLYRDGIKPLRKDPERYVFVREGRRVWSATKGMYAEPTEQDWNRPTVNVDAETSTGDSGKRN